MKRKIGLLVILLLILCGMLLAGTNKGYHKDVYSEHYVPVEEVQDELSFSIYKEMDWEQILLQKQEYLTKKAASEILEFLGLKDYIQLPEKSENAALDRGEWNAVYTEILAYLDDEKTVTTQDLLLMDVIESDSGCILVTNEGDYPSKFGQHFLTAWDNYRLYLLDGKCVGIAGISEEEAEVYNTYIKAVEDGTLTFLSGGAEYEITMDASEKDVTEGVADLVFSNGKLQIVRKKEQEIGGKLLSYDENTIEIEGYGRISHTGKIPVVGQNIGRHMDTYPMGMGVADALPHILHGKILRFCTESKCLPADIYRVRAESNCYLQNFKAAGRHQQFRHFFHHCSSFLSCSFRFFTLTVTPSPSGRIEVASSSQWVMVYIYSLILA